MITTEEAHRMHFATKLPRLAAVLVGLLCLMAPAWGQVTLRSLDGKVSLTGELVEATPEVFILSTAVGNLSLERSEVVCEGADCPQERMVTILADARLDRPVTVSDPQGTLKITGILISFEEQVYGIRTDIGVLNIPAPGSTCTGAGCPREVSVPESSLTPKLLELVTAGLETGTAPTPTTVVTAPSGVSDTAAPAIGTPGGTSEVAAAQPSPALVSPAAQDQQDALNIPTREGGTERTVLGSNVIALPSAADGASGSQLTDTAAIRVAMTRPSDRDLLTSLLAVFAQAKNLTFGVEGDGFRLGTAELVEVTAPGNDADLVLSDGRDAAIGGEDARLLLGYQAHAVIVAHANPVDAISLTDLRDVLGGRITNWAELGGSDSEVSLLAIESDAALAARSFADTNTLIAALNGDPAGLAIVPVADADAAKVLGLRESCGLEWRPDPISIQTGSYPMSNRAALDLAPGASPLARDFHAFLSGEDARPALLSAGLTLPETLRASQQVRAEQLRTEITRTRDTAARTQMGALADLMTTADQLSTVFRFRGTSLRLDSAAQPAVSDLLRYLGDQKATGTLYLIGFSDDVGGYAGNLTQSQRRAATVAEVLAEADTDGVLDGLTVVDLGMSELAPVACNQLAQGRALNRRVEVWLSN